MEKSLESLGLRLVADHIGRVQQHMSKAIALLLNRLATHDSSKYDIDELSLVIAKPLLDSLEYQSDAYEIVGILRNTAREMGW